MVEGPMTEPVSTEEEAAPAEEVAPAGRRRMKRSTRIGLAIVLVLAVLATAAFITYYILDTRNYVTTDNAQIDGNQISVNAPSSGTLIDWRATQGSQLRKDAAVGRIQMQGGFVQPQMVIRAPADGVVAVDNGVEGAYVTAGTQLAVAYDGSQIYVTARVDETDINEVRTGQLVDIAVDAFPDAGLTGRVLEVQSGAAGVFSLFPQANTSGNFQKVTQVIPVKISIDDLRGLGLVPGMNVTVKIHRD
ncbi:MAG TPA: efflux RND transporter periplasmic adaptor subunit [Pseudonocardia sp.]|nr:efflux RND transporter periplasmic adaptor subunit [Pseudonocardia sp.]